MAVTTTNPAATTRRHRRRLRSLARNRPAMVAALFLGLVVVSAICAGWLSPTDPTQQDLLHPFLKPGGAHLLGTDDLGRDVLSRLFYATRISMYASVASVGGSLIIALPLGTLAGYLGGKVDRVVVFLVDVILSVPPLILVFAIAGVLGPSLQNAIIALAVFFTPMFVRLIRTQTLRIRHSQLVEATRSIGVGDGSVILRHVVPNIAPSIVVQVALSIGTALLAEASLSFLGIGVKPPTSSWGLMLRTAYDNITVHPWLILPPAVAIALTVLAWNLLADGLRDALGRVSA
jgi:ABC-type dipeptide/oligopeptide/nickel transport system permease subunit